jgi:hypothetical protein
LPFTVGHSTCLAELLHHRLGDLLVGARPDVDDLVVALTVGDQTVRVLVLDLLHLDLGLVEDRAFSGGTTMSSTPIDTPARVA